MKGQRGQRWLRRALVFIAGALFYGAAVQARECIRPNHDVKGGQERVSIVVDRLGHPHFQDAKRRGQYYWPYFAGRVTDADGVPLRSVNRLLNSDVIQLSDGYAPLGVFFRAVVTATPEAPLSYAWEIRGPLDKARAPLAASFDSFNAAHVFDTPGRYEVTLSVGLTNGRKLKDSVQGCNESGHGFSLQT